MNNINWYKAPVWANAVIASKDGQEFYVSQWGGVSVRQRVGYSEVDGDASADMITPHDWTLVATRQADWTGEGLPPVGTVCDWQASTQHEWKRVTVIAYNGIDVWLHPVGIVGNPAGFRPIRTPEQIAAEEREKGILQMAHDCGDWWRAETDTKCLPPVFGAMWKAGYRKQPTDQ